MTIDHINIVVTDIERSVAFYQAIFGLRRGFEATLQGEWIEHVTGLQGVRAQCVFLECDGPTRLELLQYFSPQDEARPSSLLPNVVGLRHIAFNVDDLDALLARLREWNIEPLSPPVEVPFPVGNLGRKRLCYFRDPDGTLLEAAAYG